jgi:hypothetical protein
MSLRDNLIAIGLNLPENFGIDLEQWAGKLGEKPGRNSVTLVGLSAVLFYLFEKNRNPKVNDVWDAMVYCSTCLSVGYGDIFAKTPLGKILGSALMTVGPALSGKALDGEAEKRRDEVQDQTLQTLRQILSTLEANAAT